MMSRPPRQIVLTLTPDFKKDMVHRLVIKLRRSFEELSWALVGETGDHGEERYSSNDRKRGHGAVASSSLYKVVFVIELPR